MNWRTSFGDIIDRGERNIAESTVKVNSWILAAKREDGIHESGDLNAAIYMAGSLYF